MFLKDLYDELKFRWEQDLWAELYTILLVFTVTGLATLYLRELTFAWLEFNQQTPLWAEGLAWLLIIVPAYQVLLLLFGFLLGQFHFVWDIEKNNIHRIRSFFSKWTSRF